MRAPMAAGAFIWPAGNQRAVWQRLLVGSPGIDIAAGEGAPIYAAEPVW